MKKTNELRSEIPGDIIDKMISESTLPKEEFEFRLEELLKYLYIVSINKEETFIPVNKKIDILWHSLILQTKFYRHFCLEVLPGGRFIDHASSGLRDYSIEKNYNDDDMMAHMMKWLGLHYHYFGEFHTNHIDYWYSLIFLNKDMNMSLDEINISAKEISLEGVVHG